MFIIKNYHYKNHPYRWFLYVANINALRAKTPITSRLPLLDKFRTLNWKKIKRELEESGVLSGFQESALQN